MGGIRCLTIVWVIFLFHCCWSLSWSWSWNCCWGNYRILRHTLLGMRKHYQILLNSSCCYWCCWHCHFLVSKWWWTESLKHFLKDFIGCYHRETTLNVTWSWSWPTKMTRSIGTRSLWPSSSHNSWPLLLVWFIIVCWCYCCCYYHYWCCCCCCCDHHCHFMFLKSYVSFLFLSIFMLWHLSSHSLCTEPRMDDIVEKESILVVIP